NLIDRTLELEVLPACEAYGLAVIPWSPLKGGVLSGMAKASEGRRVGEMQQRAITKNKDRLEKYDAFCKELGHSPSEVGLAWVLAQKGVTAPIVGPRIMKHLDDAIQALSIKLDDAAKKKLDEIFPGPGPAPEAYAW